MQIVRRLILASASPRRRELLATIADEFEVIPSNVDEGALMDQNNGALPKVIVQELALAKARDVAALYPEAVVIGADTIVVIDNVILGKPIDADDARSMLHRLSGREHVVFTGFSIVQSEQQTSDVVETTVKFRSLSDSNIQQYIATGEPMDKAGSYGIQNREISPVLSIVGDYYNVMGLPLKRMAVALSRYYQHLGSPPEQPKEFLSG